MGKYTKRDLMRLKERRQAWIAAGLCARCGKRPSCEGVQLCEPCRAYTKQRFQWEHLQPEWREKRRKALHNWIDNNRERSRERARLHPESPCRGL